MSERYFVKRGDYIPPDGHATWYVKQHVPDHDPYIVAICNHEDDAQLVCAALNDYDARLLADLLSAKTT